MDFLEFLILSVVNLGLMLFIIRKWSLFSAEGLCMAYLGSMILTDNVELIFHYLVSPGVLLLGYKEFAFRVYPTVVHIVGLVVLIVALFLFNPRPKPVARQLNPTGILQLRKIGIAIAVFGFVLTAVALYLVSALSGPNFYVALDAYRTEMLPFGGFWDRGADIAVFGMALTLPSLQRKMGRFFLVLVLMMFVSFFLRASKSSLDAPILWGAYVIYVYDRAFFKSLFKLRIVALACAIMFVGIGLKTWFVPWTLHRFPEPPARVENILQMATGAVATRWGDNSLYRGYCQFVHAWPDYRYLFTGYKVGLYSLTSWIPRLVYPSKPDSPFLDLGVMTHANFQNASPHEQDSPLLVASAFADKGFISLALYTFLAVFFVSVLRRFATSRRGSLYRHVGYVIFVLFGGLSAEVGALNAIYTLLLGYAVVGASYLVGLAHSSVQSRFRNWVDIENAPMRARRV